MKAFSPLKDVKPLLSILSQVSIFGGLTKIQRDKVFKRLESGIVRRGSCVFEKGDEPTHIYIVSRGAVDLLITDGEVIIEKKQLGVGECFGEASLMSMHCHTATAVSAEDTEIIVLSRHALIELQKEDIEMFALLMMNIARELARRLKETDDILLHYCHAHETGCNAESAVHC